MPAPRRLALPTHSGSTRGGCAPPTPTSRASSARSTRQHHWHRRTPTAVVLGAGGASRAIVYGLIERGIGTISVANRTFERAEDFRAQFGDSIQPVRWEDLAKVIEGSGLLVNTTSLGMAGEPDLDLDIGGLRSDAVVSDIVYIPLETPLLAAAARRGLKTANGLDMLLHQAVRGFELWFGVRPEVTREQFDMLAADIRGA